MLGCDVAPLHTEVLRCCGFGKDLGSSDVKGGNGLELLSFSSCLLSPVYRISREKEKQGGEKKLCVPSCFLCGFSYRLGLVEGLAWKNSS